MKGMWAGGILGLSGQEIATLFTMDKWLDNYKVMTSMNMTMYQAVYRSTIVRLINSTFQIGMWAVDQKLKINLVWPYRGILIVHRETSD